MLTCKYLALANRKKSSRTDQFLPPLRRERRGDCLLHFNKVRPHCSSSAPLYLAVCADLGSVPYALGFCLARSARWEGQRAEPCCVPAERPAPPLQSAARSQPASAVRKGPSPNLLRANNRAQLGNVQINVIFPFSAQPLRKIFYLRLQPYVMQTAIFEIKTYRCRPSESVNSIHQWEQKCPRTAFHQMNVAAEAKSEIRKFNRCVCMCSQQRGAGILCLTLCKGWACGINACELWNWSLHNRTAALTTV